MTDPVNLGVKRAEKSGDNRHYNPEEMFTQCASEVDEDGIDSAIGISVLRSEDGKISDVIFRASNLSRMEILAVCERLKFLVMT